MPNRPHLRRPGRGRPALRPGSRWPTGPGRTPFRTSAAGAFTHRPSHGQTNWMGDQRRRGQDAPAFAGSTAARRELRSSPTTDLGKYLLARPEGVNVGFPSYAVGMLPPTRTVLA